MTLGPSGARGRSHVPQALEEQCEPAEAANESRRPRAAAGRARRNFFHGLRAFRVLYGASLARTMNSAHGDTLCCSGSTRNECPRPTEPSKSVRYQTSSVQSA